MFRNKRGSMISVLSFNRKIVEQGLLKVACEKEIAIRSDDELSFTKVFHLGELSKYFSEDVLLDIICYEIAEDNDVDALEKLRENSSDSMLVLVTAPDVSPMKYIKPGIAPDSLIIRPISADVLKARSKEVFESYFAKKESRDLSASFVLETRETNIVFPYDKISYFEACNKKINLRVENEEYCFYDSIENISTKVPEYFIRCHRAYLVNSNKIKLLHKAENLLELTNGAFVPISRSYRKDIKALIK